MVQAAVSLAGLQPGRAEIAPFYDRLLPAYKYYCLNVSRRGMAMSIEACAYLWWLCEEVEAKSVADFGSGFSSYTLRCYAEGRDVTVTSVDDNRHWLKATREFLTLQGMSPDGVHWSETYKPDVVFDVLTWDFAGGETREAGMRPILDIGNIVLFDDAQHATHHTCMANAARDAGFALLDVYSQTIDEVGRYDALAVRL